MFFKATEPRPIARQLVISFTIAAVVLLSIALGIFYSIVVRHARAEDDAVLMDKVRGLAAQLQTADSIDSVTEQIERVHSGDRVVLLARLISAQGNPVAETPGMKRLLPPEDFPPISGTNGIDGAVHSFDAGGRLFSLKTIQSTGPGGQSYTVQVAQDRSEDEGFRGEFQVLFVFVLGAGVIAAAVIAFTLTGWSLRPLSRMTTAVHGIGASRLHARMQPQNWPRELKPLAASFDEMLARLEDSFGRLSQFSADLAHELRTPIGSILGAAQVALTQPRPPEEYQDTLESIVADCERLSGIVDNLLFLARAEAHEGQLQRKNFNARKAVEKIANYYDALAEERGVKISCQGEAELSADPILFDRAMGNLVENALRHTPHGGAIRIDVDQANGSTMVEVSDTGSGIRKEDLPRVFDRFYRGDPSRSSEGTGLGLSLVRSILELHDGKASLESELGRGTTVTLLFPKNKTVEAGVSPAIQ